MIEDPIIVRSARRRRIAFLIRPEDGRLEVRAPLRFPLREIMRVVEANAGMIVELREQFEQRSALKRVFRFEEGALFPLLGENYPLRFSRRVSAFDDAFLVPGGTEEEVRGRLEKLYRKVALEILVPRVSAMAEKHGLVFSAVRVGSARGRWGSCSRKGALNFSWRLVLWPDAIVDYVIAHELAHLRELNHSARFWGGVAELCPEYRERDKFLREHATDYGAW